VLFPLSFSLPLFSPHQIETKKKPWVRFTKKCMLPIFKVRLFRFFRNRSFWQELKYYWFWKNQPQKFVFPIIQSWSWIFCFSFKKYVTLLQKPESRILKSLVFSLSTHYNYKRRGNRHRIFTDFAMYTSIFSPPFLYYFCTFLITIQQRTAWQSLSKYYDPLSQGQLYFKRRLKTTSYSTYRTP
jgi:hypothetical protein